MLKELVLFKYIYEGDSFRDSAQKAGTSIATLSRAITALEEDCGKKLFIKDGIKNTPTTEGRALYYSIVDNLFNINHEYELFRKSSPQVKLLKPIQLHSDIFFKLLHDEELLGENFSFREVNNYPAREKVYSDLLIGELDLFIDKVPIKDRRYTCQKLSSFELVFVYSKKHHTSNINISDERLVKLKWLDDYNEKFVANPKSGDYLIDSVISFYEIIRNSKYVGIVSKERAASLDENEFYVSDVMGSVDLYLIVANRNLVNKDILQWIIEKVKSSAITLI
ncbi:LysR family transcriptional regulator [Vibrio gallicus]|uniref:LysR family transcriptional regulator n=1 Tax=Vibrio gallicus TaxID=190897 RepID=UPI0021C3A32C|nr:LysR family transcriptional regulator [Vibrio gallicus]